MKKKEPQGIGEILEAMKASSELGRNLEEAQIWERWPEVAGAQLMHHGRPAGLREGTLFVEVESAVWMHRFSYHKWEIVKRINGLLGHDLVSDLFLGLVSEEKPSNPQDDV